MSEIKSRDVVQGTIKTIDRGVIAGQRMKDAYVQAKNAAEESVSSSERNSNEYAQNQIRKGAEHLGNVASHQLKSIASKEATKHPEYTVSAQQPHQESGGANFVGADQPSRTQKVSSRQRKGSSYRRLNLNSRAEMPTAPKQPVSEQSIKTAFSTAGRAGKTVEKGERTIKTAVRGVQSADRSGSAAIKTADAVFRMGQRRAVESAKAAQKIRAAAKSSAALARKAAACTAKAAKAIAQAMQQLISIAAAGGGTVLVLVVVLLVMCFAGMMLGSDEEDLEVIPVSEEVKAYEPLIRQYAKEHDVEDYVLLIEAVMMQESGGRGTDPMQCSECAFNTRYPNTPGGIPDPEYSINVGIQNLADCLQIAQCESPVDMDAIKLALQGYNYGQGYITWAMSKYGEYTKANAVEFSLKTAESYGWSSYGDMDYVPHVLRYYPMGQLFYDPDTSQLIVEVAASQIGNVGGEPYWSWYGFPERVEWCACFVSWCANQCGYIDAGVIPKFSGCEWGVAWFKQRGQWADRSITPEPGMIIFFDWEDEEDGGIDGLPDHVGIVEKVENGRIYTIEGNTADSVRERSYPVGYFEILGYGIQSY